MTRRQYVVLAVIAVVIVAAVGFAGGLWRSGVLVDRVEVRNAVIADSSALIELSGIQPGVRLYDIKPSVIEARVRQHPWVLGASTRRLPSGALVISVSERKPVAAVVGTDDGTMIYLVDGTGVKLPIVREFGADVPLIHGYSEEYIDGETIADARLRELVGVLAARPELSERLVSQIVMKEGDMALVTRAQAGTSYAVMMGDGGYDGQLEKLDAYWQQVLPTIDGSISTIDLRFHGRVITS